MKELAALKRAAVGRDPTACDETVARILQAAGECGLKNYLEVGAGEGLTAISVLTAFPKAHAVCIEKDPARAAKAREHFSFFGVRERATLIEGDAADVLPALEEKFDVIFLDGPKAQYVKYFPELKRLLRVGGVLFSDDVLLFGWVRGEPPKKRRMLAVHIREYLDTLRSDEDFDTHIHDFGEGLAESRRLK